MTKRRESGFSVIELVIVLALFLIVAAMAVPSIRATIGAYRLNASVRDVASLLQQARMAAVQANQPYYVTFDVATNKVVAVPPSRFGPPPAPNPSDPTTTPAAGVVFNAAPPSTPTLDPGVVVAGPNGVIGFNGRGMPCVQTVSPWVCAGGATAFEWFMQSNTTGAWVAVTVTPSGRIKSWRMTSGSMWQ